MNAERSSIPVYQHVQDPPQGPQITVWFGRLRDPETHVAGDSVVDHEVLKRIGNCGRLGGQFPETSLQVPRIGPGRVQIVGRWGAIGFFHSAQVSGHRRP